MHQSVQTPLLQGKYREPLLGVNSPASFPRCGDRKAQGGAGKAIGPQETGGSYLKDNSVARYLGDYEPRFSCPKTM